MRADRHGRGVGRALYEVLLPILAGQGYLTAYAGIALPNPASERLHAAIGMRAFAVFEAVGWKLGAWRDVAWWSVRLGSLPTGPEGPAEPVPFPLVRSTARERERN